MEIGLEFHDYSSYFEHIQHDCPSKEDDIYIPWTCTPHKKFFCDHQTKAWNQLKEKLSDVDTDVTKPIDMFINQEIEKNGIMKKCLTVERKQANVPFVLDFIEGFLPDIVHHRNLLANFRNAYPKVLSSLGTAEIHVDFSENLTLHLPEEIHSMYWGSAKTFVTVHSGLVKGNGDEKEYHPYFSDDLSHDQPFVYLTLKELIKSVNPPEGSTVIITSDNCCNQYKSAESFEDLQVLSDEFNINLIRIYGIAGHGKNEVDTVGGTAKIAIRTAISRKLSFFNAADCIDYLTNKFANKSDPSYHFKMIPRYSLIDERLKRRHVVYPTIKGSSSFNVLVFKPKSKEIMVAPHLCSCDKCLLEEYGSCEVFEPVSLNTGTLNEVCLRSAFLRDAPEDDPEEDNNCDVQSIIGNGSIIAIRSDEVTGRGEPAWFVWVDGSCVSDSTDCVDNRGNQIPIGCEYLKCYYLEKVTDKKTGTVYKKGKSIACVYLESVIHPLVEMEPNYQNKPELFFFSNTSYVEVINYIQYSSSGAIKF